MAGELKESPHRKAKLSDMGTRGVVRVRELDRR
jgi:hypothetical protein